jgi:molybdopterin/thiamine biosynthesis adenylyltransferase
MTKRATWSEVRGRAGRGASAALPLEARLPAFHAARPEPVRRLRNLSVAVLGAGAVAGRAALHIARWQVRRLFLADPRCFKLESLQTHDVDPRQIGRGKAFEVGRRCKAVSPETAVFIYPGSVQDLPWDALFECDAVLIAFDHPHPEVLVGQWCLNLGIVLVHAAVFGQTLSAQVRTFGNRDGQGPCPGCGFGPMEWRQINEEVSYSCDGLRSGRGAATVAGPPTRSVSSLCSLGADLAVNQILRWALGLGHPVFDTLLDYCGYTNQTVTSALVRQRHCRCDHTRYEFQLASRPLSETPLTELIAGAGDWDRASLTVQLNGVEWVERGACRCGEPVAVRRFVPVGGRLRRRCRVCRAALAKHPLDVYRTVLASQLGDALTTPLNRLGWTRGRWILLRDTRRGVVIRNSDSTLDLP